MLPDHPPPRRGQPGPWGGVHTCASLPPVLSVPGRARRAGGQPRFTPTAEPGGTVRCATWQLQTRLELLSAPRSARFSPRSVRRCSQNSLESCRAGLRGAHFNGHRLARLRVLRAARGSAVKAVRHVGRRRLRLPRGPVTWQSPRQCLPA